jgi:hypothetical protein
MRLLNLLGVDVGPEEDLLPAADSDNPRGYWEPRWIIELNDEILARLGTVWQQPFAAEPGWQHQPLLDDLRERARELLQEKFGTAQLWGWKDPRVMLTLPFWQELVPDARYVICIRNPADVISSFQRRPEPNLTLEAWGDLWTEFNARALRETRDRPRLVVFYEDLFGDGPTEIERMASFLELPAPEDGVSRQALLAEIEPQLRHHSTSPLELANMWGISPSARALFLSLRAGEQARRAQPAADDGVAEAIRRVAPDLWYERRKLAAAQTAQEELAGQLTTLRGEQANAHVELERTRQQLDTERSELERAQAEQARLREQLTQVRGELSYAAAHHREAHAELTAMEGTLESQRVVIDGLQSSLSWRLTTPLRAIKRLLRFGKRASTQGASPAGQ